MNKILEPLKLKRGYVTKALTYGDGFLNSYNISEIGFEHKLKMGSIFYWSEVYVEPGMQMIVRKGQVLINKTAQELLEFERQSKINLGE